MSVFHRINLDARRLGSVEEIDQIPLIPETPLGDDWALNMIVIYNNALRRELSDFMRILERLEEPGALREAQENVKAWWSVFSPHLRHALKLIPTKIFDTLEEVTIIAPPLDRPGRHSLLMGVLGRLDDLDNQVAHLSDTESQMAKIRSLGETLSTKLLAFFEIFESEIPVMLSSHFADHTALSAEICAKVFHSPQLPFLIPMVMRSLGHSSFGQTWAEENIHGPRKVTSNRRWKQFEKTHLRPLHEILQLRHEPREVLLDE